MNESTKSAPRRAQEGFQRYLSGSGIDIGCGADPVPGARGWDLEDGDAQKLDGVEDESYEYVYSSHCLEHMADPHEALFNWWRVLKPGGFLCFAVPDEDLYEQGIVPSVFNPDHKTTWTADKDSSWSPRSVNVFDALRRLPNRRVIYVRTIDTGYDYELAKDMSQVIDQTLGGAEAAIEVVVQKMPADSWHVQLRSMLKRLMVCPKCNKHTLCINGVTQEDKLEVRCVGCGATGAI